MPECPVPIGPHLLHHTPVMSAAHAQRQEKMSELPPSRAHIQKPSLESCHPFNAPIKNRAASRSPQPLRRSWKCCTATMLPIAPDEEMLLPAFVHLRDTANALSRRWAENCCLVMMKPTIWIFNCCQVKGSGPQYAYIFHANRVGSVAANTMQAQLTLVVLTACQQLRRV